MDNLCFSAFGVLLCWCILCLLTIRLVSNCWWIVLTNDLSSLSCLLWGISIGWPMNCGHSATVSNHLNKLLLLSLTLFTGFPTTQKAQQKPKLALINFGCGYKLYEWNSFAFNFWDQYTRIKRICLFVWWFVTALLRLQGNIVSLLLLLNSILFVGITST